MAKTAVIETQTAVIETQRELAAARAEAEKIDHEYFELSRRIAANQSERSALDRALRSPDPQQSAEEVGERMTKLNGLVAIISADDLRFRALDRERNTARDRIRALQEERARLEKNKAATVQELGPQGQAARFHREGQDLVTRAENLRSQIEARLSDINKRLEMIGE